MKQKSCGITLIELLAVVAVLAILTAILFPVISSKVQKANEESTIERLEKIVLAEARYYEAYRSYGSFEQLAQVGLIEASLTEYGYRLETLRSDSKSYAFIAMVENPSPENKDMRSFYVDQSGVVRGEKGIGASVSSLPLIPVK